MRGLLTYFVALIIGLSYTTYSYAQPIADSGCDPEYMDALEARAYLGVQRRVVQSRNMIYKPDSVLEYTCFERFMPNLAEIGDGIPGDRWFSEYQDQAEWQPPMTTTVEIDNALQSMILDNIANYLFPNFPHTYLGGHMPLIAAVPPPTPVYTCDTMQIVWNYSRCINFMDHDAVPELEWFYTFDWYSANDPRQIPNIPPNLASCPVAFGKPDAQIHTSTVAVRQKICTQSTAQPTSLYLTPDTPSIPSNT